jgi:triosephosphate isomerase
MSKRTFFVSGNWKCNGTRLSIRKLVEELIFTKIEKDYEVVVSPRTSTSCKWRHRTLGKTRAAPSRARSAPNMLKDVGVKWVIQGHSE